MRMLYQMGLLDVLGLVEWSTKGIARKLPSFAAKMTRIYSIEDLKKFAFYYQI